MKLSLWMTKNRWTQAALSRELKCNKAYLCRLLGGHVPPGKRLAQDIAEFTNGEVTYFDIMTMYKPREGEKCG